MEEIFKILNIKEINYIYMDYIDNHGNFKSFKLDYREESMEKVEEEYR